MTHRPMDNSSRLDDVTEECAVVDVTGATDDREHAGLWWWIKRTASYLLLFAVLAILLAAVVIPRISGAMPYTILTSSMKPSYPPGTMVVIETVDPVELGVGSVITYQLESGKPDVVTHRIVATERSGTGELRFITRGDNNGVADEIPVRPEQIRGELWYAVPFMGYVSRWMTGEQRKYAVAAVVVVLAGYALFMFAGAAVDHRKKRKEPTTP
jgi:signal peptidase